MDADTQLEIAAMKTYTVAAALVSLVAMSPAGAADPAPPSTVISIRDLDLTSAAGAAELRRRMDHAVLAMDQGVQPATGSLLPVAYLSADRRRARHQADALIAQARAGDRLASRQ